MIRKNTMMLLAVLSASIHFTFAQLQLPQPSPKAQVMQTVGLTDITIDYSSPAVRGRSIWGGLVPFDKVWRAGANSATKITFSKDVTVDNTPVTKGSYSIFMIPSNAGWTIILNKDAAASEESYKQENDVVRIKTFPATIQKRERLMYSVTNFSDDQANVDMEWDNMRVSFTVKMDTDKQALDNIKNATGSTWRVHANAARYHLERKNLDAANSAIDQAVTLAPTEWYALWIKAQVLAEKKDFKNALVFAQRAKDNGDKNPSSFWYKDAVETALKDWKNKK